MKKGKIINHVGFIFSLKKKKKIVLRTNRRRFERIEVEFECLENDWDVLRISRTDDLFLIKKKKEKYRKRVLDAVERFSPFGQLRLYVMWQKF